ncbi:MAG: NAD(P)H dehydrogenase (quinone) [Candidatus Methanofastidiosum methylothiophilum]|uniref:NAD(P)H dehydrogenase (Quinone) n=1 Tax=Candidatus Methanofastidiosum methylothiophilum TaxID=1705564 RepID=A0A150J273_9EURY|nr:MAG: NAD(P)H dehydrogenase (quinone) [Candidatus Methanofastidiosum methylthiophilus]NMC76494.1 flavodoxin [Candidatus Methanofastidiosa archaeon]
MKIGLIVYSKTGNTYEVSQKLEKNLSEAGHSVNIERIEIDDENQRDLSKIRVKSPPGISKYEAIIFGAPVNAFSLCPEMTVYMSQLPTLKGKKIACFVTKGLPLAGTGGNQAISKMKNLCESKGGSVSGTGIVIWNKDRDKQITNMADEFNKLF